MKRDIDEFPEFQKDRIYNLVHSRGYGLLASELVRCPLAKTPDGEKRLVISTTRDSNAVDLEVRDDSYNSKDLPVMDEHRMRHLAR